MAPLERAGDGFCSWEEEEDMDTDMHSPTDVSEDSVDVKVKPILGLAGSCNKRKCAEPVKFGEEVKRLLVDDIRTRSDTESSPFRPWSETPSGYVPRGCPVPDGDQDEPLSLVLRDKPSPETRECQPAPHAKSRPRPLLLPEPTSAVPLQRLSIESHAKSRPRPSVLAEPSLHRLSAESHVRLTLRPAATELSPVRLTPRPAATELSPVRLSAESHAKCRPRPHEVTRLRHSPGKTVTVNVKPEHSVAGRAQEVDSCGKLRTFSVESLMSERPGNSSTTSSMTDGQRRQNGFQQQRNYKNMTRERRVEANARERTRVHTISAAFDSLRRAVPAYSHNQKLSKLSVLRIACAYILTLSRVAGEDYSADNSRPALGDCVDHVTRTIQLEGKLRKKKDD